VSRQPDEQRRRRGHLSPVTLLGLAAVLAAVAAAAISAVHRSEAAPRMPAAADYVAADRLTRMPVVSALNGASTGSYVSHCGRNEVGHRNADNVITVPGKPGGAMHEHDYVGNLSTNAYSTDQSLAAAGTTCGSGDRSSYYWTVLRAIGPTSGHPSPHLGKNTGRVVRPDRVLIQFRGNPTSNVVAMPRFLRALTGNAKAFSQRGVGAEHVQWGCSGLPGSRSAYYPLCPPGQQVTRTFDFPGCWDGLRTDSPNHRTHLVFAGASGACPPETYPVPQLHVVVGYSVEPGRSFAIDTMPAERRSPITDHSEFINVMPDALMARVVNCINTGTHCG
jgi:uncharacterized protein DUF1996